MSSVTSNADKRPVGAVDCSITVGLSCHCSKRSRIVSLLLGRERRTTGQPAFRNMSSWCVTAARAWYEAQALSGQACAVGSSSQMRRSSARPKEAPGQSGRMGGDELDRRRVGLLQSKPTRRRMRVVMKEFGNLQVVNRRSKQRLGTQPRDSARSIGPVGESFGRTLFVSKLRDERRK